MTQYVHITFDNARLFPSSEQLILPNGKQQTAPQSRQMQDNIISRGLLKKDSDGVVFGIEKNEPIPLHCIANVIRSLCMLHPHSYYHPNPNRKENKDFIDEWLEHENVYIRFDQPVTYTDDNEYRVPYCHLTRTQKTAWNANTRTTTALSLYNTSLKWYVNGEYTLYSLRISLHDNKEHYNALMNFFMSYFGRDYHRMSISNLIYDIDKCYKTGDFNDYRKKLSEVIDKNSINLQTSWRRLFVLDEDMNGRVYNEKDNCYTSTISSNHIAGTCTKYTLVNKGISYTFLFSGEIVIPVNDKILELIKSGPQMCSILDNGGAMVTKYSKIISINHLRDNYHTISKIQYNTLNTDI